MTFVRTHLKDADPFLLVNCEGKLYIQKSPDVIIAVRLRKELSFYHIYQ